MLGQHWWEAGRDREDGFWCGVKLETAGRRCDKEKNGIGGDRTGIAHQIPSPVGSLMTQHRTPILHQPNSWCRVEYPIVGLCPLLLGKGQKFPSPKEVAVAVQGDLNVMATPHSRKLRSGLPMYANFKIAELRSLSFKRFCIFT